MYPNQSNLFDGRWGSLWFVGRTNGRWNLYETAGPVVFVQLQKLLLDSVSSTDRTYDGTAIGPTAFAIDGVIGTNSMRRLWVLASKRGLGADVLGYIATMARSRPSTTRMTPALLQVMLHLLYPSLVPSLSEAQLSIASNGAPYIGSSVGLPVSTTAQVAANPAIFSAGQTSAPFDAGLPPTSISSIEALRNRSSGLQVKFSAPWTTFAPPVVIGSSSPPTFIPHGDTVPTVPQPGIVPLPPTPQAPPMVPVPAQSGWTQQVASSAIQVGSKAMPLLPFVAAAGAGVVVVWLIRRLR